MKFKELQVGTWAFVSGGVEIRKIRWPEKIAVGHFERLINAVAVSGDCVWIDDKTEVYFCPKTGQESFTFVYEYSYVFVPLSHSVTIVNGSSRTVVTRYDVRAHILVQFRFNVVAPQKYGAKFFYHNQDSLCYALYFYNFNSNILPIFF